MKIKQLEQEQKNYDDCIERQLEKYKKQQLEGNTIARTIDKFTDETFPNSDALFWKDQIYETQSLVAEYSDDVVWERIGEKFEDYLLWGPEGVRPDDSTQGKVANCWLIAAISAFAENPNRIYNIFHNTEKNEQGAYSINLYALGVPYTIYIDDYLPFKLDGSLLFSQVGSTLSLWGPLLEKAIAKYVGNYWHMDTGYNVDGVSYLNGGPFYYVWHLDE